MKKKIILIILVSIPLLIGTIFLYHNYRIKHAKIEVTTIDNLNIEVYSNIKTKDLIKSINGKIINNKIIDTKELGTKTIKFKYINNDNIKIKYSFDINIVDKTPPVLSETKSITITKGYKGNLKNKVFCADNYDSNPKCQIIGDYNLAEIGTYQVTYQATDSSNNTSFKDLTINVVEPNNNQNTKTTTNFKDIYTKFKNKNTKIGIDISRHQGDIDYQKLKEEGVEFAFLRVGYGYNKESKNVLDEKFIQNIKGFNKVGIPVGIYYFSYAENNKEAKNQAKWVLKQIKKYKVDLPIVFDWENWTTFKDYNLSLYNLNDMAKTFINQIENKGYQTMLYSSKNYLKYAWNENDYNIWIAHYNENANYENQYKIWQICDDGIINGIKTSVDIDIMYKEK